MDAKQGYSDATNRMKLDIEAERGSGDAKRHEALVRGMRRMQRYMRYWKKADMNDLVEIFAPGAKPVPGDIKIRYFGPRFIIVADVVGYARILPIDTKKEDEETSYVDLSGNNPLITQPGISRSDYRARTHFFIKRRQEMK